MNEILEIINRLNLNEIIKIIKVWKKLRKEIREVEGETKPVISEAKRDEIKCYLLWVKGLNHRQQSITLHPHTFTHMDDHFITSHSFFSYIYTSTDEAILKVQ